MAKQTINIGTTPNDGTGDPLRTAFTKVNENFTEVYSTAQSAYDYANTIVSDTQIDPFARERANAAFDQANTKINFTHIELTKRHEPTGSVITFTRPANTNISDVIDTGISFARANNGQGLYNSAVEESYNAEVSPANTEWNWSGWSNLDNVKIREYRTWREALRKKVGSNIVGAELVMHDLTNDKYYKVQFTNWDIGGVNGATGAFEYTRELIDTSTQVGVVFEDGTNQITALNPKDWPIVWLDNNNYTLRLIDANKTLRGYDMTLSVPRDSDVNFPIGTEIQIFTESVGITVERVQHIEEVEAQIYGVGFGEARASWEIPAHSFARMVKVDTNLWYLVIPTSVGAESGGSSNTTTTLPYVELTNNPFIIQEAELGESVEFTRTADGSQTDSIDTGLILARGSNGGLYNADSEASYDNDTHDSPAGTRWNSDGWDNLLNLNTRDYGNLRSVLNNAIGNNIVGAELIMHDTINNKYYKFEFTDWGQNNGGSFAYTRTLITDPNIFIKTDYGNEVDIFVEDDGEGSGIGITRANNQSIYNPYREEGYDEEVSPDGTLWNIDGWDDLTDIEDRTYVPFYEAYDGGLGSRVPGSKSVMYIPETEKYYAIEWLSWTQNNNGGGFSYNRYELNLEQLQEGITFNDGTVLKTASGIGRVKSTASGNRKIEEASGNKTVSVTSRETVELTTTASRSVVGENRIWIDLTATTIDDVFENYDQFDVNSDFPLQFSLDNVTWYDYNFGYTSTDNERGYNITTSVTYNQGDTIYFRYTSGGLPTVWWNKNELPSGGSNFRGAVIDYHAYTGEGTFIGTIHIVDDSGEEHITHTEVSSGGSDSGNDDLWLVQNEGTISYRRLDGESKTLKVHWTAKVFYGSEYYD
jgi:hypothetical protein